MYVDVLKLKASYWIIIIIDLYNIQIKKNKLMTYSNTDNYMYNMLTGKVVQDFCKKIAKKIGERS